MQPGLNLKAILAEHAAWCEGRPKGECAYLRGVDLKNADLRGADLRDANLNEVNLEKADLSWANLSGATLAYANLEGAQLEHANLSDASLHHANLKSALLNHAHLCNADLRKSNLDQANLSRTFLSDANLSQSFGLQYAQCAWTWHGERGRQLLAVRLPEGVTFFCGCFRGTAEELQAFIARGPSGYRKSRTTALEFLLACMDTGNLREPEP